MPPVRIVHAIPDVTSRDVVCYTSLSVVDVPDVPIENYSDFLDIEKCTPTTTHHDPYMTFITLHIVTIYICVI